MSIPLGTRSARGRRTQAHSHSPERILTRRKANAASTGDTVTMEWRDGVFLVPATYTAGSGSRKDQAGAAFPRHWMPTSVPDYTSAKTAVLEITHQRCSAISQKEGTSTNAN